MVNTGLWLIPLLILVSITINSDHITPISTVRHVGGAMLREGMDLSSAEVAMVHRGERVLLLQQVGRTRAWGSR